MWKKILVLPTWLIVKMITPFLKNYHPWHNKAFSLNDWARGSTTLNNHISLFFWVAATATVFFGFLIIKKYYYGC